MVENKHAPQKKPTKITFADLIVFAKTHKKLLIGIALVMFACITAIFIISSINAQKAKEITKAQIGKCYMVDCETHVYIYYFQEEGYSELYISYEDEQKKDIQYVYGTLDDIYGDYSFSLSLLGTPRLEFDHSPTPIVLDGNHQIVQYKSGLKWTSISLDEAMAIEKKSYSLYQLTKNCKGSSVGPEEFSKLINGKLEEVADQSYDVASDSEYIDAAKALISQYLKNPNSAIFNSASVVETDQYGRGIVHLNVSAQNSFGGYTRSDYYICIQSVRAGHYTYYQYACYVDSRSQLDSLKMSNSWGKDPTPKYDASEFLLRTSHVGSSIEVSGFVLVPHVYKNSKITYIAYIEQQTGYVLSAEIIFDRAWLGEMDNNEETMLRRAIRGILDSTGNDLISPNYSSVFDIQTGIVENQPVFTKGGLIYQAKEVGGQIHFTCTNASAFGFTETNYWTPAK